MKEIKCLICGMIINTNNYSLNDNSFIEKNIKEKVINCPFCGVDSAYLSGKDKPCKKVDKETLDEQTRKVLDKAMKLEIFNGEFYKEASKLANEENIKKTFKDLSNIELMHARIHKNLGWIKELPKLHKPDYTKYNTDKLLLEEANKREKHAVSFYEKNSCLVSSDIVKEVFNALSYVESQHEVITKK